ncbi:MAG: hypothetical protein N2505_05410 [Endomicrobia bacterium]|nr:hypothetical protein [Endomicrobiia bacterium]
MCIIGVYKKGAFLDEKEIENMWISNDDGVGFSIYNENTGKWDTIKGIMSLEELKNILREKGILNNTLDTTFVIHFRAATHGGIRKSLTHPFMIKSRDEKEILLYHNGVFSIERSYARSRNINEYEMCGVNYGNVYTSSYSYGIYSKDKVEENLELEDIPLDPEKLQVHSDTSLVALLVSELSIPSDSVVKLFNSPLMKDVISYSKVCLCIEGNSEPVLIGNWVKEDELKTFSNHGYKDIYSQYGYKTTYSSSQLYKSSTTTYYKNEDYESIFNEIEKNYKESYYYDDEEDENDKKLVEKDYQSVSLGGTTGIIFPIKNNLEVFLPVYYNGKPFETSNVDYELLLVGDGLLYVKIEKDIYPVYFLYESQKEYLRKYNFKNRIGIAVDKNFNFYFVNKIKDTNKFKLYPVKKQLKNPVPGYFYDIEEKTIEAIEDYHLIENKE